MYASNFLPIRFFSHCSKLCGTKLLKLNTINGQTLPSVCSLPAILTRSLSVPASHRNAWMRLHLCRFLESKSVWSAAYSSSANTKSQGQSNLKDSTARTRHNLMTNPFKKERIENQSLFREIIASKGDSVWTDDDWAQFVQSLPLASQSMWEVICMHTLYIDKNISVARQLMMYLESRTSTPSIIVLTFYIGVLGETSNGSEDQDQETFKYYQLLLSQTDVLDAASTEVLISGLSMTKYYHECLKLLKICLETSTQSASSLIKILRAGLRNKDMQICQFALAEFEKNVEANAFNVNVPAVVDECLAVSNQDGLEMVMNFIQKHKLLLSEPALEEITDIFNRHQPNQWTAEYGFIHHTSGQCVVCGHQMKRLEVSDDDFKAVQSAFLEQVIVGRNVFFKSSPVEVDTFITFVKNTGPFDVVIDGLNVIYSRHKKANKEQLEKAVEYYSSLGKKTLILGSRMLTGYIGNIKKMVPKPEIYMTNTTRADDAFFLYAALHSGKNTLIVSGDKLRDHKFLLDPSLRHIFHQWVLSAQVYDWYLSRSWEFRPGKRHLYHLGPAQDEGGWHIPVNDLDLSNPFGKFSVMCLRNKSKLTASQKAHYRKPSSERLAHTSQTRSAEGQTRSAEGQTSSAEGQTRSAESQTRPAENQTRPAESQTRPAESQTRPAESQTRPPENQTRSAENQTRAAESQSRPAEKGQKHKHLSAHNKDKDFSSEMPKKFDRKLQQSKNSKLKSEKEWFED